MLNARQGTSRSSIRCGHNYRLFRYGYRSVSHSAFSAHADKLQTVRSNEQMMQSMKGATVLLGSMNRQMNLPALQRIAMEFEKENDIMDQRQEMMDDAIDDVTGLEDEEESEEVVNQVLDEIGIDLGSAVCSIVVTHQHLVLTSYS
jgi:division protein CdvB (Snf7/Vps24/ESCRT-III family)